MMKGGFVSRRNHGRWDSRGINDSNGAIALQIWLPAQVGSACDHLQVLKTYTDASASIPEQKK